MNYSFLDSASLMNVTSALTLHNNPEEWGEWEWESITQTTQELIFNRYLKISPAPSIIRSGEIETTYSSLYSNYDLLVNKLIEIDPKPDVPSFNKNLAESQFKNWFVGNITEAKTAIKKAKEAAGYKPWMNWAIKYAWVDHAYRQEGLFNKTMISQLSATLQINVNDLSELWEKCNNIDQVKKWSKGENTNTYYDKAEEVYFAAAVLRGKHHHFISNLENWNHSPHPMRQYFNIPFSLGTKSEIPWTAGFFSHLIFNSAMTEEKPRDRILHYVNNIHIAKEAYLSNKLPELDNPEIDENTGYNLSKDIAKKIKIQFHPTKLENQINAAWDAGAILSNIPGFFVEVPWSIFVLGATSGLVYVKNKYKLDKVIAEKISSSNRNLSKLATSKPGLIARKRK